MASSSSSLNMDLVKEVLKDIGIKYIRAYLSTKNEINQTLVQSLPRNELISFLATAYPKLLDEIVQYGLVTAPKLTGQESKKPIVKITYARPELTPEDVEERKRAAQILSERKRSLELSTTEGNQPTKKPRVSSEGKFSKKGKSKLRPSAGPVLRQLKNVQIIRGQRSRSTIGTGGYVVAAAPRPNFVTNIWENDSVADVFRREGRNSLMDPQELKYFSINYGTRYPLFLDNNAFTPEANTPITKLAPDFTDDPTQLNKNIIEIY